MANKGKKKQKKPLRSIYHQEHIQQTQQRQKARDLKYKVQESLEQRFVDWDELPEAEQQEILEREIKAAEEELDRLEREQYLASLPTMDPDQQQAGSSTLPTTTSTHVDMTREEVQQAIGALSQLMHDLTDRVIHLTTQVTTLVAANPAAAATAAAVAGGPPIRPKSKDNVKRPESWKGKGSSADARYFLAAFANWAFHMEDQLNDWSTAHNTYIRHDAKWIQAVLNLMDEDARTWILPHLEELMRGTIPFGSSWQRFEREFIKRWIPQDMTESAREALKNLKQGKNSVAEFMAKFDQHTGQTGWSPADHRQRFYDGLNDRIKDTLSYTDLPIATFEELRNAASKLDKRMHQREAEKRGTNSHSTSTNNPQKDPNAMDIDASRQNQQSSIEGKLNRNTYLKWMTGKCFGCGSQDHSKKDGHHERDVCNHCGKTGHRSTVCFSKYMKKPKKAAGAAATTTESTPSSSTSTASATTSSPAKDSKQQADLLAQLMEKVRAQE